MKILVIAGILNQKALNEDENVLTRRAFEEYFNSKQWRYQKDAKNILGTLTHRLRNDPGSEEGMGFSDELLLRGVITHCVTNMYLEDNHVMAEVEVFDDLSLYSEDQKSIILQLLRLVKAGVQVGCSLVLNGMWDDDSGELEHIIEILGLDLTLQESFTGSRVLKIIDDGKAS